MVGQPHGEELGQMKPFSNNSSNYFFISANSLGAMQYGHRDIGAEPGSSSMENSTSLSGGNPGRSLGKTSGNSHTTGIEVRSGVASAWAVWGY